MAQIISSGIGSGLDISGLVGQLVAAERAPVENRLNTKEAIFQAKLSAYGTLKSTLSDFQDSLTRLQDSNLYLRRTAISSETSIFTASAAAGSDTGEFSIQVEQLAAAQKIAYEVTGDSSTVVGTGTLTFTVNGQSFDVDVTSDNDGDTLAGIRDAVNAAEDNTGVRASIVSGVDGGNVVSRLVFTSEETGADNAVSIAVSGATGNLGDLAFDPTDPTPETTYQYDIISTAQDSQVFVDGLLQTSANNTVDNAIEGVTLNLKSADPGQTYDLSVSVDQSVVSSAISTFVESYNTLRTQINQLTAYNPETGVAGLLQGDSTTRSIADQLRRELSGTVAGVDANVDTLAEIGITTKVEDGTLEIDSSALNDALDNNLGDFSTLFNGDEGFATRLDAVAETYTRLDGLLDNRTDGLKSQIDSIGDQREALNRRIAVIEQRFLQQFTALDTLLGQLNSTSNFLSQQLQNLPKPSSGNS